MLLPVFGCAGETGEGASGSGGADSQASTQAEKWVREQIEANTLFSFEYGGKAFSEFIGDWDKKVDESADDAGNKLLTLTYTQPDDKVVARADILLYKDFPAVDWVVNFENQNSSDSPVISNIQALDAPLAYTAPPLSCAIPTAPTPRRTTSSCSAPRSPKSLSPSAPTAAVRRAAPCPFSIL